MLISMIAPVFIMLIMLWIFQHLMDAFVALLDFALSALMDANDD